MMAHVPVTPRVRRMLDALPGSIVAATVLPIVVRSGPAAGLAVAAAALVMILRGNSFLAVAVGVFTAALLRAL
jgi:Branched-chain amino acid transport protein (AzlD).